MFSTSPIRPITLTGSLQPRDGLHGAKHGGRAGHVALHGLHAVARFQRQAARVERHALADQRQDGLLRTSALVSHDHQSRFVSRPACYGQQGFAAFLFQSFASPDLRFQAAQLGGSQGLVRKAFWIDDTRRVVHQTPRQVDRLPQDLARCRSTSSVASCQSSSSKGCSFFSARYRSCPSQAANTALIAVAGQLLIPGTVQAERHAFSLPIGEQFGGCACRPADR